MSEDGGDVAAEAAPASASIAQCVALLRATGDEQKFVGLLLATKLMKTAEDATTVFDAAMPFVRRLLLAPKNGEDAGPYRGLALSVLASFGMDPDLAARSEFSAAASTAAQMLHDDASLTAEALRDVVSVLGALLRQPQALIDPTTLLSTIVAPVAARVRYGPSSPAGSTEAPQSSSPPLDAPAAACMVLVEVSREFSLPVAPRSACLAVGAELVRAAQVVAAAVASRTDALSFGRLGALRALLEARVVQADETGVHTDTATSTAEPVSLEPDDDAASTAAAVAAVSALAPALRSALSVPLASKLDPIARADALRAAASATSLCGPRWLLCAASGGAADPGGAGAGASAHEASKMSGGTRLSLLLQLCSVELQMCLHDQPSDTPLDSTRRAVLPACCALLEQALFRLHADGGGDEDEEDVEEEGEDDEEKPSGDPWLDSLSDSQVLSANQAFQRAVMVSLEYLEAVRAERAEAGAARPTPGAQVADGVSPPSNDVPSDPLLAPVARLVSAWLAQPSASTLMELYDRASSLLPLLRDAADEMPAAEWAGHLRDFEPREHAQDADDDGADAKTEETMADLFTRLMPQQAHAASGTTV